MDWLKLFALLVAVATVRISAEAPKKKIRIHLPQKVKHIHHHKKIYITNHSAASQYAPAFMPSAEGAMSVPTNVALPAGLLPVSSIEMYEEQRAPASSKLLPMYRARGYYGPNPTEWDDQEYDLSPPPEPTDHSYPSAAAAPMVPYHHKKVKIVKLNDSPKKKAVRKGKPKRPLRPKPSQIDEEIPVSTFHEQFYSDLDGSATLKKVKKPQRVEKIIDGDNEHIHTYSEEHVHKLVYNDGSSRLVGIDPVGGMSALSPAHSMFPIKNPLLALSAGPLSGFAAIGSMGTPSHLEYAAYNPRDVTHDHVFHDHGEIPSDADVSKENLPYVPRISYNSQGLRIGGLGSKGHKTNYPQLYPKPTRPTALNEYSYYENMYSAYGRPGLSRPTHPTSLYPASTESNLDYDYKPVPSFKLRDKANIKTRNVVPQVPGLYFGHGKQVPDFRSQQSSVESPYAISSTIVHDYKPKNYASFTSSYNKHRDPLQNFKDNSYSNNFDIDSFASATNLFNANNQYDSPLYNYQGKRGKKKSISTQNIRIGGLDHQTTVDHLGDSGFSLNDGGPTAFGSDYDPTKSLDSATSTPFTIRENSFAHPYYTAMAAKALQGEPLQVAAASNTNFQYVEPPAPSTTEFMPVATTNVPAPHQAEYFDQGSTDPVSTEVVESTEYIIETRPKQSKIKQSGSSAVNETRQRYSVLDLEVKDYKSAERPRGSVSHGPRHSYTHVSESLGSSGSRKYGDKI